MGTKTDRSGRSLGDSWRAAGRVQRAAVVVVVALVVVVVIAVVASVAGGGSSDSSDRSAKSNAEVLCRTEVQSRVSGAGYGDFHQVGVARAGGGWHVSGEVEADNQVGGRARAPFSCQVDGDDLDAPVSVEIG